MLRLDETSGDHPGQPLFLLNAWSQNLVQPGLNTSEGGDSTTFLGQPVTVLDDPQSEKMFFLFPGVFE